jgi:hypothetical protein
MSRAIVGTQGIRDHVTTSKQPEGGTGRIRCPSCQGIAARTTDTITGAKVLRCGGCGKQFSSTPL